MYKPRRRSLVLSPGLDPPLSSFLPPGVLSARRVSFPAFTRCKIRSRKCGSRRRKRARHSRNKTTRVHDNSWGVDYFPRALQACTGSTSPVSRRGATQLGEARTAAPFPFSDGLLSRPDRKCGDRPTHHRIALVQKARAETRTPPDSVDRSVPFFLRVFAPCGRAHRGITTEETIWCCS